MKISPEDIQTQLDVLYAIRQTEATLNTEMDRLIQSVMPKDYLARKAAIEQEYQDKLAALLTPDQQQTIEDIRVEFAEKLAAAKTNEPVVEKFIRDGVLGLKESVTAKYLRCKFVNGRRTVKADALQRTADSIEGRFKKLVLILENLDRPVTFEDIQVEVMRLKLDLLDLIEKSAESTAVEVLKVAPSPTNKAIEDTIPF